MLTNLKKLRLQKGVSQKQLADVIGVSQQAVNKYENHSTEPEISVLIAIASYFNTSIDNLVGYDDGEPKTDKHRELIQLFDRMTAEQQDIYLAQGKAFFNTSDHR